MTDQSAPEPRTRYRYVSRCVAMSVEERFEDFNHRKDPNDATKFVSDKRSIGWWVRVSESSAVFVGMEKPDIVKGDSLRHILEKES